ncbi:hypothetical protein HNQ80_001809 [Anaerosolibacter carboniphilus]|uniref:DNRLRE domain-containing protein n=1 Tax=Anaerosolibacter carboniphilus TaxID=1417629 RepID=A0A841KUN3_9FIRM|nr:DNRLRE domain-containing protein [Anaerosolibacter carboniphilus]MBB6215720.1 hypothetical protein [Anaerosolibacter carboniphilus]
MSTVIINPQVEVAQVSLAEPSRVFGMRKSMHLGRTDFKKIYRMLFKFPISMIPHDCVILKALLKIYVQYTGCNILSSFAPYALQEDWSLFTLNWNNQPAFYTMLTGEPRYLSSEGFYAFNITKLVSMWYNNEIPNYGLIIKNDEVQNKTAKQINAITNSVLAPMVEISYVPKCETQVIPTHFISQVEELNTDELYSFSSAINTSLTKTITYHIENLGNTPVEILLQVSANPINFINDSSTPKIIAPHELVYAIPYTFAKYLRIAAKNIHPGETSKLKIWYQAQE